MATDINNPYFRNEVLSASPAKLRLLLLDGCVRFMREGRDAMVERDYEEQYQGFSSAKDILTELIAGMNRGVDPQLCDRFGALYTFVFGHLTEGAFEKDAEKVDECIRIMEYERETWAMLMEKSVEELSAGDVVGRRAGVVNGVASGVGNGVGGGAGGAGVGGRVDGGLEGGGVSFSA